LRKNPIGRANAACEHEAKYRTLYRHVDNSGVYCGLCRDELLLCGGKYFGPKVPGVVVPTEDGTQADVGATVDGA